MAAISIIMAESIEESARDQSSGVSWHGVASKRGIVIGIGGIIVAASAAMASHHLSIIKHQQLNGGSIINKAPAQWRGGMWRRNNVATQYS